MSKKPKSNNQELKKQIAAAWNSMYAAAEGNRFLLMNAIAEVHDNYDRANFMKLMNKRGGRPKK